MLFQIADLAIDMGFLPYKWPQTGRQRLRSEKNLAHIFVDLAARVGNITASLCERSVTLALRPAASPKKGE
jgi:hypothetical protein